MRKEDNIIDECLVIRLQSGDKDALSILVKRWHKLFCNKAYYLVKDKEAAKDIAQESWSVILKKINHLRDPKQFKYWAYRIIVNKSTDWLRQKAKSRKYNFEYKHEVGVYDSEYSENEDLKKALLKAIKKLPINQLIIVKLFYVEDYSLKHISELLNISIGTAKSRLFHAREKLKKTLKHRNYEN